MTAFRSIFGDKFVGGEFVLSLLQERNEKLKVRFEDKFGTRLEICFDEFLCYRRYDEGVGLRTLDRIEGECGLGKYMYETISSDFIDWFIAEGYGKDNDLLIKHYVFMGVDEIVDVLSTSPPDISESGI